MNEPPIRAHVVLRGAGGSLSSAVEISAATIGRFTASREVREQASDLLRDAGFRVLSASPLSVSIEAPPETFERFFRSPLRPLEDESTNRTWYSWERTPRIPESLRDLVDQVVLPEPARLSSRSFHS